jgi:hypothetical protein
MSPRQGRSLCAREIRDHTARINSYQSLSTVIKTKTEPKRSVLAASSFLPSVELNLFLCKSSVHPFHQFFAYIGPSVFIRVHSWFVFV